MIKKDIETKAKAFDAIVKVLETYGDDTNKVYRTAMIIIKTYKKLNISKKFRNKLPSDPY